MPSPYPWHYSVRWPLYYHWPSTKQHSKFTQWPLEYRVLPQDDDELTCILCGDIMVLQGDVIPQLSEELIELISQSDVMIGNCEAPVGMQSPNPEVKYHLSFNMPQANLANIIEQSQLPAERWLLSYANNHSFDQGYQACIDTEKHLSDIGVVPIGAYHGDRDPLSIYQYKNIKLGLSGWTHWMNKPQKNAPTKGVYHQEHILNRDWQQIKSQHQIDYLIGLPHWEYEFQHFSRQKTRDNGQLLVDQLGFDFILGSHPHTLQGMDHFAHGFCQYSLGNFCGLGVAWPVKLIPLLEIKLQKSTEGLTRLAAYQFHFFVQEHHEKAIHIIPLSQAEAKIKQKMKSRIALLYQGHIE